MNKRQKELLQVQLDNEKAVLKKLKENYADALAEINSKMELLMARQDADMQHVIYRVEYQKAMKKQVQAILETLQNNEFETISEYLTKSYDDGFVGAMYELQGSGIPLVFPIDQEAVVAAIQHETKLSEDLYTSLGRDVADLRKKIAGEISRGISTGMMSTEIARNISSWARIPMNNAMRIARTESHRIQNKAISDAQFKAKDKGADVVKVWSAALDGRTRTSHRKLDGQIRELEEPFEVDGRKVMYPGGFGRPEEDCNCRCRCNSKARWLLGEGVTKWASEAPIVISDDGTTQLVKIPAKEYNAFKKEYFNALDTKVIEGTVTSNGIFVRSISKHQFDRMEERGISIHDVKDALEMPLHVDGVIQDELGRKSQRFIGKKATVNANPDIGKITTTWKTGKRTANKYRKGDNS